MASNLKKGDPVFVNGRSGKVIKVLKDDHYTIETDDTGFIQDYHRSKLSRKHPRCDKCKRRLPQDYKGKLCGYCKSQVKK
jgi:hypothetical protein